MTANAELHVRSEDELEALIRECLPADGVVTMRTFRIPAKARKWQINNDEPIPLNPMVGDLRVGIAVYDHQGKPTIASVVESFGGERVGLKRDIERCITALIFAQTSEFAR